MFFFYVFQNDRLPDGTVSGQHEHGYTIRRVDRYDAGRYTCTADNGVGSPATAHINLQVLCEYMSQCLFLYYWLRRPFGKADHTNDDYFCVCEKKRRKGK